MCAGDNTYPQFSGLGLTVKQQAFVIEYCNPANGLNATHCYAKAYGLDLTTQYDSAKRSASRLLSTNVHIMAAIDAERARFLERHDALADFIMGQWYKLASADFTQFIDVHGGIVKMKEIENIPPHLLLCVKSITNTAHGVNITLHDKDRALENIAKALGLFVNRVENVNGDYEKLVEKIDRNRREEKDKSIIA